MLTLPPEDLLLYHNLIWVTPAQAYSMTFYVDGQPLASRVSDVYSDGRYNWMRLCHTFKLPEVGGDFRR